MAFVSAAFSVAVPSVPVGSVQPYAGTSAPNGWLLCDSGQYLITQYGELYSVLSTTYGTLTNGSGGAGTTHFRVPDMRGRVPMGAGTGAQQGVSGSGVITGGTALIARTVGQFGGDERMQDHNHQLGGILTFSVPVTSPTNYVASYSFGSSESRFTSNVNSGGLGGTPGTGGNMPPFVVLNYIIKATSDIPRGGITASSTPPIVTSLPANPQFGDQVVYAADATNGVYWTLQYDGSGTYPWKFVGGAPLVDVVAGGSATANPSYVPLSGPTRSIVLPGDYDISASFSASYAGSAAAAMGVQIGAGGDEDYAWGLTMAPGFNTTHVGTYRKTVSSAVTLTSKVKSPQSVSVTFAERVLSTTPVRVKAA